MENALLVGLSRQVALARELDIVANNIANLNTTGFKSDGALFEEYIGQTARAADLSGKDARVSFVRDRATWVDLSQGTLERTGNALDVAIEGSGFFAVQTPRGERYTRNGAFQVNAAGELVTSEGYQVVGASGPIRFQAKDRDISISLDGTISVREGAEAAKESQRGKIRVVQFDRASQLQKDGAGTFSAPDGVTPQPADATKTRTVQGSIEKSNVRSVVEMTRMIEVTRSYTQVAQLLQQQSEMQRSAIEKLADVPA
ncbi:MAG: flagellar basal-body rod protein FlgF [Pseudolabrys sp.]|nr:flagellar basal-body rod protein FlgF [Pseudolabrys sp.]MBV9953997.1 flagellar basal-body rod protein FlgF [Pseudolabrys sp.]